MNNENPTRLNHSLIVIVGAAVILALSLNLALLVWFTTSKETKDDRADISSEQIGHGVTSPSEETPPKDEDISGLPPITEEVTQRTPDCVYVEVEFADPLEPTDLTRYASLGLDLHDRLDKHTWWACLTGNAEEFGKANKEIKRLDVIRAESKISDTLKVKRPPFEYEKRTGERVAYSVMFHKGVDIQQAQSMADSMGFQLEDVNGRIFNMLGAATVIVPDGRLAALAEVDLIARIEPVDAPAEPTNQGRGQPLSKVDKVQEEPIGLDGSGVTVGVWEVGGTVLAEHLDLTGRVIIEPGQTSRKSGHATHVAGTIGSSGTYIPAAEGMAPNSQITSWDHTGAYNEMILSGSSINSGDEPNPVQISNHSYGRCTGWNGCSGGWWPNDNFGAYTIQAGVLDRVIAESGIAATWSAGNSLNQGPRGNDDPNRPNNCTAHRYDEFAHGPDVFADCINAENGAKNVITVAAMANAGSVAPFSSYGPMDDGRIKPDLAAQGNPLLSTVPGDSGHVCVGPNDSAPCASAYSGTSMSSPLIAGVAALIMGDVINNPSNPFLRVATRMTPEGMKALLIQTAQDVSGFDQTKPGPDYATGWGIVDAEAAVTLLREGGLIQGKLDATGPDKAWTQPLTVPSGQLELHVTLAWTDPPGNPAAEKSLVNDLDLRLFAPDGTEFTPWVLGGMANPTAPAIRNGGNDSINNVEQVSVLTPQAGEWLVMVKADKGNMPFPQTFAVAGVTPSDPDLMVSPIRTAPSTGVVRISPTPTPTATPDPGPTPTPTITPSPGPTTPPGNGPKLSGIIPSTAYQRQLLSLDGETADTRVVWDVGSSNEVDVSPVAPITPNYFHVPKNASPGVHQVAIRNSSGTSNSVQVTVLPPSGDFPAPRIEDIGLRQGGAGERVLLISGANLDADAIVTVDGANASSALFSGLPIAYMKDHIPATFKYPVYHYSQLAVVAKSLPVGATLTLATTNADGQSDNMKYTLPTDWKDVDSDGDGLLDRWEEGTYTAPSGTTINLAAMGVHKYKKDILIEADWVKVAAPPEVVWTKLEEAFANAPVLNPDGTSGVNHIVDRGQGGPFVGGGDLLTPNHQSMSYSSRFSDYESSWYPDASKLVIGHNHNGKADIGVINADGSGGIVYLTKSGAERMPFLSPDGSKIGFNSKRDGNWEIYVMNSDGSGQTRLTNNPATDSYSSWSPDGAKIAFNSTRDGNTEIYVMNSDGSGQTRLTNNPASDQFASWSPDGAKIAFNSRRDGNWEIYVMNSDGSGQTRLTNNPATDWLPSWSPDNSKLAFISDRDGHGEIYEMDADGRSQKRVMSDKSDKLVPRYSPDGNKIAFAKNIGEWLANGGGNYDIHTVNTDGTGLTKVTDNSIQEGYVTFATHKERHFNVDRLGIFKYLVLARSSPDALGIAEFPFGGPAEGDDFWVALATWTNDPSRIASVTMHELGHDLGLSHGGIWPNPNHNTSKPNFPSIMSYRYAADGISTDCNNTPDGLLTFTQGQLKDIVESATDENIGICDNQQLDMNNDGQITSGAIDSDGRSGVRGTHIDYDQWGNMVIDFMNR